MKVFGLKKNAIMDVLTSCRATAVVYGLGKMGLPLAAVFAERGTRIFLGKEQGLSGDSLYQPER